MNLGIIGKFAKKLAARIIGNIKQELDAKKTLPKPAKPSIKSSLQRLINYRLPGPRGIFGPSHIPEAKGHHVSRQTCRAYLRGLMFQKASDLYPFLSRRDRRRHARIAACLEYRRMMQDTTNAIPDSEVELYKHLDLVGA